MSFYAFMEQPWAGGHGITADEQLKSKYVKTNKQGLKIVAAQVNE